jgi:hypothetical protein
MTNHMVGLNALGEYWLFARGVSRVTALGFATRIGRFRRWPSHDVLIDEPLSLAEDRTNRLRSIYTKCAQNLWDGPTVFRDAVTRHGGIQLERPERVALAHIISTLMWGELAAWIISAELAERLDDPDARMAASSQVFDEARHFYVLRDYLALLHVPTPPLDPYFAAAVRSLLDSRDLTLKLMAMQILAEGSAQSIFRFLAESGVEPVLCEILPYIERDEARHVGLGILHLPERLSRLSPRQCRRVSNRIVGIGDMLGVSQLRAVDHYRTLGLDPRELFRLADGLLTNLSGKLGTVPGTGEPYFRSDDPADPRYEKKLDFIFPKEGSSRPASARLFLRAVALGARAFS